MPYVYQTETAGGALVEVSHENHDGHMVYCVVCEVCNDLGRRPDVPGALEAAASRAGFHAGLCTQVPPRLWPIDPAAYQINARVYVKQLGSSDPFGAATVRELGTNGIGQPIARIWLDEIIAIHFGRRTGKDGSGTDVHDWWVGAEQLELLERAA
jgi:hypothetical protein